MKISTDEYIDGIIEQYYQRLINLYKKKLNRARNKLYAHEQLLNYFKFYSEWKDENDIKWSIIEVLKDKYYIGDSVGKEIKQIHEDDYSHLDKKSSFAILDEEGNEIPNKKGNSMTSEEMRAWLEKNNEQKIALEFAKQMGLLRFIDYLENLDREQLKNPSIKKAEITNAIEVKEKVNAKEFTTSRQVLAIHYLLKVLKVNQVDKTEIARFVEFLTGKNYDNVYFWVRQPLKLNNNELQKDLNYILDFFKRLKIKEAIALVNKELQDNKD